MCFYFSAVDSGNASEYEEEIDLDMNLSCFLTVRSNPN